MPDQLDFGVGKLYICNRVKNASGTYDTAGDTLVIVSTPRIEGGALKGFSGKPLTHRVLHSPTGFSWGYGGSGPADLARSICWDVFGSEPEPLVYQHVKFRLVAILPVEGGIITERQVRQVAAETRELH